MSQFKASMKLVLSSFSPTNNGKNSTFDFHNTIALQIIVWILPVCALMVTLASLGSTWGLLCT